MTLNEKHYSIDPGIGEKMEGCPYSTFEDGHDVRDFIVPPKDYDFVGFRFEPLPNNQIYDGKLVAQYEKSPIKNRLSSNIWKILIPAIIVAVAAIVILLAVSIFRHHSPKPKSPTPKKTETVAIVSDSTAVSDSVVAEEQTEVVTTPTVVPEQKVENQPTEKPVEKPVKPAKPVETPAEKPAVAQETQQPAVDANVQFKNEFWSLIHQRTILMDPYHDLFVKYKGRVSGEEYEYLRLVILKDYVTFKEWSGKLHEVPVTELKNIHTITELKSKLN